MKTPKDLKTNEELRKMDSKNLLAELQDGRIKYFKASFEVKSGQTKRSDIKKYYKKYIAAILTIINEKSIKVANQ